MNNIVYLIPAAGLLSMIVMIIKRAWVIKQDAGEEKMKTIAVHIADGAMAFLRAEWKVMAYFVVITALLLGYTGYIAEDSSPIIAVAFIIGAFLSALAGYIGMNVATKANVRTTQAAKTSLKQALKVSFSGGTVMGLGVAGLAVLGLSSLFIVFVQYFVPEGAAAVGIEM